MSLKINSDSYVDCYKVIAKYIQESDGGTLGCMPVTKMPHYVHGCAQHNI